MYKWFVFQDGTYWVYQEQTTLELDTVKVTDCNTNNSVGGWRTFNVAAHSTRGNRNINYYFNASFQYPGEVYSQCTRFPIGVSNYGPGGVGNADGWLLFYPFIDGEHMTTSDAVENGFMHGKTYIEQKFQDYLLPGENPITNVVRFYCTMDESNFNRESRYDFAKNIGLVRKELVQADGSKEVWALIAKNIVQ
jgi:hypothetical protein